MYHRFHRAFSQGMQEYVEARLFLSYSVDGKLATPETIDEELQKACSEKGVQFHVDHTDYVLGVADLTGEIMRRAVAYGGTQGIMLHEDVSDMERAMNALSSAHFVAKDMGNKMRVLHQSVEKVQKRCYDNAVRCAEGERFSKARQNCRVLDGESEIVGKKRKFVEEPNNYD